MSNVLPFLSMEDRRIRDILPKLKPHEIEEMPKMLEGGFTFSFYRFEFPISITRRHLEMVKQELERRTNDGESLQVP